MADTNGTKVSPAAEKVQKNVERPKIFELNMDNCRKENVLSIVEEHPALETLSLINTGLSSLKGFPKLPNLKKLRLADNRIADGLNYLANSSKLQNLDLSGNKIKELKVLEELKDFKQLTTLDLFNNEVTQVENYREKLFKILPSLKFLDGMDSNNLAAPSDDDDDVELNGNDSDEDDSEDDLDEYDEDDDDDSVEEEDMSLAEIYNEDLEEDNSDWEEGEGGDDDDDEIESDDENEPVAAATAKGADKAPEADEPTNKKRKTAD